MIKRVGVFAHAVCCIGLPDESPRHWPDRLGANASLDGSEKVTRGCTGCDVPGHLVIGWEPEPEGASSLGGRAKIDTRGGERRWEGGYENKEASAAKQMESKGMSRKRITIMGGDGEESGGMKVVADVSVCGVGGVVD